MQKPRLIAWAIVYILCILWGSYCGEFYQLNYVLSLVFAAAGGFLIGLLIDPLSFLFGEEYESEDETNTDKP